MTRVLVAMSGGVDSSVTAYLLQQQGYECVGATMMLHRANIRPEDELCGSSQDIRDAKSVCEQLGMQHLVFDCTRQFEDCVVRPFIETYEGGGTPNPCVDCNRHLKFGYLLQRAEELGCEFVATGHYARVQREEGGAYALRKAADPSKDQSYVLHVLTAQQLPHVLFPLGQLTKRQVREIAEQQGFRNAHKGESQDICFIPDGDYVAFLERERGSAYPEGQLVDDAGAVLGQHGGMVRYTIGQRKGLGVAMHEPYYVCGKNTDANQVVIGPRGKLQCRGLQAKLWNWLEQPAALPCGGAAKIRYRQSEQPASVTEDAESLVTVMFAEPVEAIAPGQAVVLYDGDKVLGGGTITCALR